MRFKLKFVFLTGTVLPSFFYTTKFGNILNYTPDLSVLILYVETPCSTKKKLCCIGPEGD
jgi:hypothetical protein